MHETPLLVQAAEAVLRGALEPAIATRAEDYQLVHTLQASLEGAFAACGYFDFL